MNTKILEGLNVGRLIDGMSSSINRIGQLVGWLIAKHSEVADFILYSVSVLILGQFFGLVVFLSVQLTPFGFFDYYRWFLFPLFFLLLVLAGCLLLKIRKNQLIAIIVGLIVGVSLGFTSGLGIGSVFFFRLGVERHILGFGLVIGSVVSLSLGLSCSVGPLRQYLNPVWQSWDYRSLKFLLGSSLLLVLLTGPALALIEIIGKKRSFDLANLALLVSISLAMTLTFGFVFGFGIGVILRKLVVKLFGESPGPIIILSIVLAGVVGFSAGALLGIGWYFPQF